MATETPERKRTGKAWIGLAVALVVGLLIGAGTMAVLNAPAPQRTFTVIAYHWGFAIYDEAGAEIPKIQVAIGTVVTLEVIGAEALSHEIHEVYEERTMDLWADNPAYGGKNMSELMEEMESAETAGYLDHSVQIAAYNIDVVTDHDSPSPKRVTFVANQAGTFDIECNVYCGWGHQYMNLTGGLVVT